MKIFHIVRKRRVAQALFTDSTMFIPFQGYYPDVPGIPP